MKECTDRRSPPQTKAAFLRLVAIALFHSVIPASVLNGQQTVPAEDWAGGFHGMAMIARGEGLELVSNLDEASSSAGDLVLFVSGTNFSSTRLMNLIDRGASVLVAVDSNNGTLLARYGLVFRDEDWLARYPTDSWNNYRECPLVKDANTSHPVMKGIQRIATNRPAIIFRSFTGPDGSLEELANFPSLISRRDAQRNRLRSARSGMAFAIAGDTGRGGKLLAVSDPSVFCNQMIVHGDNARFAIQAMQWLGEGRQRVAFAIDGQLANLAGADEAELRLPPPTREEILEALQNLPPEKLLEFGNVMANMIEDENLVNDFLAVTEESFSSRLMKQIIFSALTVVAGFFIWYGFFSRDSLLDSLFEKQGSVESGSGVPLRQVAARQRRHAAQALLSGFLQRFGVPGGSLEKSASLQLETRSADGKPDGTPQKQLSRAIRSVLDRKDSWWTPRRLRRLETQVGEWTRLHELGLLVYDERGAEKRRVGQA